MVELNNSAGLMIWGAISMIIGIALLIPMANDIALIKVSSRPMNNETVTLTVVTANVVNETVTLVNSSDSPAWNRSAWLANNYVTALTGLRDNVTQANVLGMCNISSILVSNMGNLTCNSSISNTSNTNISGADVIYADYTFRSYSTGALVNNELISFDSCSNATMIAVTKDLHCNVTLTTGAVKVNYDNFTNDKAHINYTYEPDTYVSSGAARTVTSLTLVFFAIGILAIGIVLVIKGFKDMF